MNDRQNIGALLIPFICKNSPLISSRKENVLIIIEVTNKSLVNFIHNPFTIILT